MADAFIHCPRGRDVSFVHLLKGGETHKVLNGPLQYIVLFSGSAAVNLPTEQ